MTASNRINDLTAAVHAQILGTNKTAKLVKQYAAELPAIELAELMTSARIESRAKLDKLIKIRQADAGELNRAFTHSWGYVAKVAAAESDHKFLWDRKTNSFLLEEKPAANEKPEKTAAGKDKADPKATSEAIQENSAAAPELSKTDALYAILGAGAILGNDGAADIIAQLIKAGISIAALESAVTAASQQAAIDSQKAADKAAADALANGPQAGQILLQKLANKPAQKRRASK